jgi:ribosomal protein S30
VHLESSKSKRLCTLGGGGLLCLRNFSGGGGTTGDSSWGEIADCVNNAATARLCASQKKRDLPRRRTARRDETRDPEGSSGSSAISTPPGRATPPKLSAARKNTPAPRVYFLQYFRYFKLNIAFVRWHFRVRRADQYDSTLLPFSSPSPLSTIVEVQICRTVKQVRSTVGTFPEFGAVFVGYVNWRFTIPSWTLWT